MVIVLRYQKVQIHTHIHFFFHYPAQRRGKKDMQLLRGFRRALSREKNIELSQSMFVLDSSHIKAIALVQRRRCAVPRCYPPSSSYAVKSIVRPNR